MKKTENAVGTWKTTYTMFDGDNPLMQKVYTASGRIQTAFNIIVGGRILAQYKMVYPSTASVVYFYLDNLGSRRVVISSIGAVVDRYRYSPWGVPTQDVGSDDYRSFTGKDYDATGMLYFNARYYDPMVGRFLTEDPSRKGTGWYTYCENNPVNNTDPTGLWVNFAIGAGIGFFASTASEMVLRLQNGMGFGQALASTFSDPKSLAVIGASTAIGALTSGASALAANAATQGASAIGRVAITAGVSAVGGAIGSVATDVTAKAINSQTITLSDELRVAGVGAAVSAGTGALGEAIASTSVVKTTDFTVGTGMRNPEVTYGSPAAAASAVGTGVSSAAETAAGVAQSWNQMANQ